MLAISQYIVVLIKVFHDGIKWHVQGFYMLPRSGIAGGSLKRCYIYPSWIQMLSLRVSSLWVHRPCLVIVGIPHPRQRQSHRRILEYFRWDLVRSICLRWIQWFRLFHDAANNMSNLGMVGMLLAPSWDGWFLLLYTLWYCLFKIFALSVASNASGSSDL